jgi:hypothetical protein
MLRFTCLTLFLATGLLCSLELRAFAQSPVGRSELALQKKRERIGSTMGKDLFRDQLPNSPTYSDVVELFMSPVLEEFHKEHGSKYELTDDEIRAAVDWATSEMRKRGDEDWERWEAQSKQHQEDALVRVAKIEAALANPETPEKEMENYRKALRVSKLEATHPHATEMWFLMNGRKFEQYLFDYYGGGRIILQQLGPEALDARRKLLLELEKKGKFEVTDPELRKLAYDYWERPKHPGGFHTDRRYLAFPWTKEYQDLMQERESGKP